MDHVLAYKVPKEDDNLDELTQKIHEKGVAPSTMKEYEETSNKGEPPSRIEISDETDDERGNLLKNSVSFWTHSISILNFLKSL